MSAEESLTLIIVRHGESESNKRNMIQGHSDSGLTQRGHDQSDKVASRLKGEGIQKIYSSDLGRAQTTAKAIEKQLGLTVNTCENFREIKLGDWEGLTTDEVNSRFNGGYFEWLKSPSRMHIPNAEKIEDFHKRVRSRVDRIFQEEKAGPILLVTHGGVIASLLSHWLKADFDSVLLNLRVDNTSLTVVEKNSSRIKIHQLNNISHLSADDISQKNIFTNR